MMTQLKYRTILLVLACFFCASGIGASPVREFTKSIMKEFDLSRNGIVGVVTKYGNVDVRTWDGAKVKFEVTIKVEAKNEDAANEVFNRINVVFDNSQSAARARTEIEAASSWKKWFDWGSTDEFRINYVVYMPATADLELENRYGDIFVADKQGRAQVVLKYGDMRLGRISGNARIEMAYSDGVVDAVGDLDLRLAYSDLHLQEAGSIELDGQYSDLKMGKVGNMRCVTGFVDVEGTSAGDITYSGKYDDFIFESVRSINGDTKYSDIKIGRLQKSGTFKMAYGGLIISGVPAGFEFIDLNTSYTDIQIDVDEGAQFQVDADVNYCDIRVPGLEATVDIEKSTHRTLKGYKGASSASSRITARMAYGGLTVR